MTIPKIKSLEHFFKDSKGQVAVWQAPNKPLYGWILFKLLSLTPSGHLKTGFGHISTAFLFTWAYLELTKGVSYFRRSLGLVVLIAVVIDLLK